MTSGTRPGWQLPSSVTSGLAPGTVMAWQAQAETGSGTVNGQTFGPYPSGWSDTCYFAVYPKAPDAPPTVTADFTQTTDQGVGSPLTFTITQSASNGDTAAKFVWALDNTPPLTGTIPAAQTCTTAGPTASCTQITTGTATLTINVPSPGPHDLWVYEQDGGGNDSGTTNDAAPNATWTFSGAPDQPFTYANFGAALSASKPFDNTMVSTGAGAAGGADGDGSGNALDEAQLQAAGWAPKKTVTVDGAEFTLPDFGTSTSAADNLLAANQTIGMAAGSHGSSLVFLASSTIADATIAGLATGSPDTTAAVRSEVTAPAVMGGVPVSASGCAGQPGFNATTSCSPATGTVRYASGCAIASSPYTLTVPDWSSGPSDIAALVLPGEDSQTGQSAASLKLYAFAVPVDANCTVASVKLPDVSRSVTATVTSDGSVTQPQSALHIFGMSLRDTTTATTLADGSVQPAPSGQAWTGAFEAPAEEAYAPPSGATWGDQTIRIAMSAGASTATGGQVRIKLADPGFTSHDGMGPLVIGAASIAAEQPGSSPTPVPTQKPQPLTFAGSASVTVPEGGDVYSDPVTFPVTTGEGLLVTLWVQNASVSYLPWQSWSSGAMSWFAPTGTGSAQQTLDTTGTPFTGAGSSNFAAVPLLAGVDVTTAQVNSGGVVVSPGEPTVVVAGNNVIDGGTSGAVADSGDVPSQRLAGQIISQQRNTDSGVTYGVVDAGVQSNQVIGDGTGTGGVSLIDRIDADVLAEPDLGTVVLDEGLQDLLRNPSLSATNLGNAYTLLEEQLYSFGAHVVTGDLTPCSGYQDTGANDSCSAAVDATRNSLNSAIDSGGGTYYCAASFDGQVSNDATPPTPEALAAGFGTDGANLTLGANGGYAALAPAVAPGPPGAPQPVGGSCDLSVYAPAIPPFP
ncbi:MAG TPA: hypothetical protein VGS19_33130 [Streptosporangiaceae bacterium]|nr:hypothetical protein [Streptosporangiaceae bacterium]